MIKSTVSIVVPVYNRENFLRETIESVIRQTHSDWELLLVDDGSSDKSLQIAEDFAGQDGRVKSIKRQRQPKGASTCRNIGMEQAKGEYVIFLDSDDLMAGYCLEQRISKVLKFPNNDFWVFQMMIFNETIGDTRRLTNYDTEESDLNRFLRSDIVWTISGPIWKKESLLGIGGFDESFSNCDDHDLHLRALFKKMRYRKYLDEKPDTFYRKHEGERIYNPNEPLRVLKGVSALFKKLASEYSEIISNDYDSKDNLSFFLFTTIRKYTRNVEFTEPKQLITLLAENRLISTSKSILLKLYVLTSSIGMNRVRGFERIWNTLMNTKKYKKSWGKKYYKGTL